MKRKRGNKKGKPKKPPVAANEAYLNVVGLNTEDNSGLDDFDNTGSDSVMEVDTPSSTGTDQPDKLAHIKPDGSLDKKMVQSVYGRVKVKLRTAKVVEPQPTSSDAPTPPSDTDKSSQRMGLEKHGLVAEKVEDIANSVPETKIAVSGNVSKKSGSIKIKSSRSLGSSSVNPTSNAVLLQGDKPQHKELKIPHHQTPRYNKQELDDALTVIKKVMKMEAAEPFNAPVNPVALGIPDYFEVIDTPMDFGTICRNLENGVKYRTSEDVFKDVQYIWENCIKYNNKGDYIIDLVKRVKKNFTKYWSAAGLYNEQTKKINGAESNQAEDVGPSSQGKAHLKGGPTKQKKGKRHGFKRHKDGCLCAICILKRRRKEREANSRTDEDQTGTSENNVALDSKHEETESPGGEDTSSNMDNSLDPESEADDLEDKGEELNTESVHQEYSPHKEKQEEEANEMEIETKGEEETPDQPQLDDISPEDPSKHSPTQILDEPGVDVQTDTEKEEMSLQDREKTEAVQQQNLMDSERIRKKAKMYENLTRFENPMLLELCGTLFPDHYRSVWNGPHSLVRQQGSGRSSSPIHAALETFMKVGDR